MENIEDCCNKKKDKLSKCKSPSSDNDCAVREASNVILLVSNSSETGKYIQTLWYLKHINSIVAIDASDKDENGINVVKITARDGGEVHDDEQLLVTSNTLISYVVQSYRFVFVIDISPSTFVVDGTAGCVPHSKIINRLRQCLEGLLMGGSFLGANKFSPQLFITICFYSPFIAFDEDRVILQGCLLTKKNISSILHYIQERFALFSNKLCWTMQPHLRKWNQERKKLQQRAEDLLPENFFRQQFHATDGFRDSIHGLMTTQMAFRAGPADEGFINSGCSIVFMLRAGLIGLQLLPDTAQPNIILITDAVCNVTDIHTLQKLMIQLRNYSVACSFIQIQRDCNTNAVFGHFSSPEFFTFLARGTSGVYIPDEDRTTVNDILDLIDCRPLLCKNLQLLNVTDDYIKDLIHQINPEFVEPYAFGVIRRMHYSMEYESCLEYFLRSRLYEGFILRNLEVLKKGEDQSSILVEVSLPWKPQVTIGYKIYALYENHTKRTKLKITVICEAQYGMIRDLLSDRCSVNTTKQTFSDAYRHTILGLLETDRMLIHIYSFNSSTDLFRFPPEILKEKSLFRYVMKENKALLTISTRELETLCSHNVAAANFVEFWRIISEFEERHWKSWSQVYTFRVILTHDHPLPPRLFLAEEPNVKVTSQLALTVFYDAIAQMTTFSLVHGQTYVKFVEKNDGDDIPKSFYIIKLSLETQLIVIKFAFLNGLTTAFRNEVIKEYQENLSSLSVERSCFFTKMLEFADVGDDCVTVTETVQLPALTIIDRPLEIILARYKKIPLALNRIIRLEKTDETNGDVILHNSLAKYFSCRRFIWYLKKAFPLSSVVSCTYADFILHTILQRRLNEGFHIVYGDNGIINLVKHIDGLEQQLHCGSFLLQYIIFPPTAIRPMRIVKERLEKGSALSKTVRMREVEMKKSVPSENSTLKNDFDIQLMTEIWSEPLTAIDPLYVTWTETIQQQIRDTDEDIICTLSTLDQVMSLCTHHCSCSHFTLANCQNSWEFLNRERLSKNVEIMHNCFCLQSLLKNAIARELLLLPTLSYQNDDSSCDIRLRILLENLHCELAKASNVTIEVRDPDFWMEITGGIDQSILKKLPTMDNQRSNSICDGSPTRVYISRLSPWRAVIIALLVSPQHILMATSLITPTLPLLIFHCDEPWIAHHLARNEPWRCETYVSDHRTKSPTSTLAHLNRQIRETENFTKMKTNKLELHWLSTSRISPAENRIHTSFDLHSYCEAIEDQLFSRALIGAVYQCLLQGVHIPYEDLVEVLEDRCEQSDIEVEGIDECVRFLCSHVANIRKQTGNSAADADDEARSNDLFKDDVLYRLSDGNGKSCEKEQEDFRFAFDELLSRNFRKIPNFPSYFYFIRDNGTHLASANLTINLPETKNFTSDSSLYEDLEICYIEDEEDVEGKGDNMRSSQSSISFESVTASELSIGEAFYPSDNTAIPLFLNFSCAMRFSNMDMCTFPIDHLPCCVMQLLKQCSSISKKNFMAMDLIGISFDIYVLSWPMRQFTLTQSDSCTASPKTLDKSSESLHKFTTYFDFDRPYSTTTSDVISQLPHLENEAVRRLECGIIHLLHMETVFVLSRYDDVTLDTLYKVMVFITKEQRENNDTIRFRVKLLQIVMVMEQVKAVRRLKERIKNFNLLYCKLQAHPESNNLFYCCQVTDIDLYEDTLSKQARSAASITLRSLRQSSGSFIEHVEEKTGMTVVKKVPSMEVLNNGVSWEKLTGRRNSSVPILEADRRLSNDYGDRLETTARTGYSDHDLRDFWIIVNVEMQQIQVFFCERYAHHHEKIFELLLEAIQKECHTINQEFLLEKMHSLSECDSLLIENDTESHKFTPLDLHDSIPDTKLTRSLINKRTTSKTKKNFSFSFSDEDEMEIAPYMPARVFYPPGHFACRIVAHHWFYIHPRLHIEVREAGCSLVMGYDALRQGIEQFAVRNRRNLYVYCEDNKRNVFYMQLFASEESFRKRCLHCDTTLIDEVIEKFQNNVLLTVHGIHEPTAVVQSVVDVMQKRLELKVLEELTDILHKNPRTRLTTMDVEFIQRDPAKPFAVHYCTLPNYIYDYLGSLYYYMYQQMLTFTTEARFRNYSGSLNRSSPLSHERPCFHSQSDTQQACNNYIPHFFLISKPSTKGSSNMGIACIETRIVNWSGACIDSLKYARINPSTHSKLYPGGGKFRLSLNERFHELTRCITTSLPLPDSLLSEKTGGVSYLVQYTIWQVGDVGVTSLQPIFRLALQQALCDLISEFGLLSIPLLEDVTSTRCSSSNTLVAPYIASEERIRSSSDASHLNFVAKTLRKAESHTQSPLLEHLPQELVSSKLKSSTSNNDCQFNASINYQFIMIAAQWFDHVVSEVKNTEHQFSVKKYTFHCESDHSVQKIFSVIQDKLSVVLKHETIVICQLEAHNLKCFSSQNSSNDGVLTFNNDSGRIVAGESEEPSLIMLAYNHEYSEAILKYGANSRSNIIPTAVEEILHDQKASSMLFLPQIAPFVPRQHVLYLLSKGETATLYLYNYSSDAAEQVYKMVSNVLSWQNARSRLLREIGLHKMGVTHLSGRITPTGEELVWLNSELLSEYEIPQHGSLNFDKRLVSEIQFIQTEPLMHLYRHTTLAFLPLNLSTDNLFEDQCSQMVFLEKQMKSMLYDYEQFNRIHGELMRGAHEIRESDLLKIISRSREVHFIRSPLLLFPKWRKLVAVVRRGTENSMSSKQAVVIDSSTRHISGSKISLFENSSSISSHMRATRSNTFSALLHSPDHTLRKFTKSLEEDEPCCLKIQFMLVESYVKYLKKIGLRLLNVTAVTPITQQANTRYSLHYDMQNIRSSSPNVWMCKVCDGGILFVHVTIIEPYFSVQYLLWNVAQLNRLKIKCHKNFDYNVQRNLHMLKDNIISKAHVHSFTYDFHLRMVATYLIGGQQVLFNYGYNTNDFLIDFLQYYSCRPSYACNCIYEEKMTFPNLPITNQKVWEYLLDEKRNNWRIVRLKTTEMDMPGQFMIVAEDDLNYFGLAYKEIRAIVHENQLYAAKTLNIKFYVMLVSHEKIDPLDEILELDGNCKHDAKISGEFKKVENSSVNCITNNYRKSTEGIAIQDDTSNVWCASIAHIRRRCRSGDNNGSRKETTLWRNYSNGMKLSEFQSMSNEKIHKLSIQNIAPLRHRRTRPKHRDGITLSNPPAIVPREQAFYICYMSRRQKRLQKQLEDSVMHYKRKLQMIIEDAVWHCKRNQLWDDMLEKHMTKRETIEMTEQWKLLAHHSHDVTLVLRLALSTSLTTTELDNLLGYVKSEFLNIYEPLLDSVISNLNPGVFFKLLIQHFGLQKCRLFCSFVKEHLVIITAEAQQAVFLFTSQNDEPLQMRLLVKECKGSESGSLLVEAGQAVREQFNELVRCAASSAWMNLVHISSSVN